MIRVLNRQRDLNIIMFLSVLVLLWLVPITGSTEDGGQTFLLSITETFYELTGWRITRTDGATPYIQAGNLGIVICFIFALAIFVCIFQSIRLSVRKHLASKI